MKDDTISRQAAIDALADMYRDAEKWGQEAVDDVIKARAESCMASLVEMKFRIEKLPSAQPEQRKGEWIDEGFYADGHSAHAFRCSECGGHIIEYDADPFCRWCGADMRGEQDDS